MAAEWNPSVPRSRLWTSHISCSMDRYSSPHFNIFLQNKPSTVYKTREAGISSDRKAAVLQTATLPGCWRHITVFFCVFHCLLKRPPYNISSRCVRKIFLPKHLILSFEWKVYTDFYNSVNTQHIWKSRYYRGGTQTTPINYATVPVSALRTCPWCTLVCGEGNTVPERSSNNALQLLLLLYGIHP
jgi:hypothetical protein